jgi:DNA-directed RNA polymerase specialized sigma24 family protein
VVQDSSVAMHGAWRRLRDSDRALSYLRQSVVHRSRSELRQRMAVERAIPKPPPGTSAAEYGAIVLLERSAVVAALRSLPPRQREALVLRYYGDMTEAQIASVMGYQPRRGEESHGARDERAPLDPRGRDIGAVGPLAVQWASLLRRTGVPSRVSL